MKVFRLYCAIKSDGTPCWCKDFNTKEEAEKQIKNEEFFEKDYYNFRITERTEG